VRHIASVVSPRQFLPSPFALNRPRSPDRTEKNDQNAMYVAPFDMPLDEIRRELDRLRTPLRIAIQRSKNPFNVGAIIRVAHSFMVREIVLIGEEPYYERASMGMEKYENITRMADEESFVAHARAQGWNLVAIEKDHPQAHGLWDYAFPDAGCVMVFGSENQGLSPVILAEASAVVAIPMFGINHSYPVSVAAGIAMAEWSRRYWSGSRLVTVPREP
jgi:tRNA G18 (ribose-2'-O)-methylase SpoU